MAAPWFIYLRWTSPTVGKKSPKFLFWLYWDILEIWILVPSLKHCDHKESFLMSLTFNFFTLEMEKSCCWYLFLSGWNAIGIKWHKYMKCLEQCLLAMLVILENISIQNYLLIFIFFVLGNKQLNSNQHLRAFSNPEIKQVNLMETLDWGPVLMPSPKALCLGSCNQHSITRVWLETCSPLKSQRPHKVLSIIYNALIEVVPDKPRWK